MGCAAPERASDSGFLRVIIMAAPVNFDPRVGTDQQSQRVHQLVYDHLLVIDDQLRIVAEPPALALRLDNPDPLTYIAHLRRGVRFHDGRELTAKDVVYTFASFLDPDFVSPRKGAYAQMASVKALDDYTVEFKLKEPFGSFSMQLVMHVVPDGAGDSLRTFPIGTGPYRFVRYVVDEQVELTAYEGYWDGLPQNAGITLRIIPDDMMRGLELRKGSADLTINDVPPDIAYQLEKDGLTIAEAPGVDYTYIGLNMRDPVLSDKRVRHAIGYAVDRQAIVEYLRRGLAQPAVGVLSPVTWAFEPNVHQFTYDPERARRLLDEAGYPDPDGDGPLPRLRLSLKTSTDEFYRLQAAVIQENLRLVGVEVDVRSYEFATFYADVLSGNVQMYTLQWVGVTDPDMLRRLYHSGQVPPVGFNRVYYSSPEVDRLIDLATTAPTDEERRKYYSEVQKLVAEDAPYISLWYKTNIAVARPNITGIRLSPQATFAALKDVKKFQPYGAAYSGQSDNWR
ncbi:MAG: ABC transporter substrate-binding protein [Acidobacteria bacterium]|nr:ABC transporter substrate-binding protein [Acidobacteriota bacterium]